MASPRGRRLKIYILKGLPGSGKSTKAKELLDADKFAIRVNKDLIREMFQFGGFKQANERFVVDHEYATVRQLLSWGRNVIIDDTNLNIVHENKYREIATSFAADVELIEMQTPLDVCIARDESRREAGQRYVGPDNIKNMAFRFGYLTQQKPVVIFDLDGTLSDPTHRRGLVRDLQFGQKPDWMGFFRAAANDLPRTDVIRKMHEHRAEGNEIIIVSACPEDWRDMRTTWLRQHGAVWDRFIMRNKGDYRKDDEVKQEILDRYLDKTKIVKIYDDRQQVIRMWRRNGLLVEDVGNGEEF